MITVNNQDEFTTSIELVDTGDTPEPPTPAAVTGLTADPASGATETEDIEYSWNPTDYATSYSIIKYIEGIKSNNILVLSSAITGTSISLSPSLVNNSLIAVIAFNGDNRIAYDDPDIQTITGTYYQESSGRPGIPPEIERDPSPTTYKVGDYQVTQTAIQMASSSECVHTKYYYGIDNPTLEQTILSQLGVTESDLRLYYQTGSFEVPGMKDLLGELTSSLFNFVEEQINTVSSLLRLSGGSG